MARPALIHGLANRCCPPRRSSQRERTCAVADSGVWTGARRWFFESDGERLKREGANFISFADAAKPSRWEQLIRRG